MYNPEIVNEFYSYYYTKDADGDWWTSGDKIHFGLVHSRNHDPQESELASQTKHQDPQQDEKKKCYYYFKDENGQWFWTTDKKLFCKVKDTDHFTPPEITSTSRNDHRESRKDGIMLWVRKDGNNKQFPPVQLLQTQKNENKYNTTCIRCGLVSHRSTLCPTYPYSKTQCDICKRFHRTSDHREPGKLEKQSW